jgi:conjugative transposon TraK protein
MFKQLTQIESAFKLIRTWTFLVITGCLLSSTTVVFLGFKQLSKASESIYVIHQEQVLQATLGNRKQVMEVEARDHVRSFHHHFFSLAPDEEAIKMSMSRAMYLADQSAKEAYDNLREKGYFSQLIAANLSQSIQEEEILIYLDRSPIEFEYHGIQKLVRSSSVTERKLVTKGRLREVSRSDNNPHGFLIERWETIYNRDIKSYQR